MRGFVEAVMGELRPALELRIGSLVTHGRSPETLGTAADAALWKFATIRRASTLCDLLGPFVHDGSGREDPGGGLPPRGGGPSQAPTPLALRTPVGFVVHAAFQFDEQNRVLDGLPAVLQILAAPGVDDGTLARWLVSPSAALDAKSPVLWLREGRDGERLLVLAEDAEVQLLRCGGAAPAQVPPFVGTTM